MTEQEIKLELSLMSLEMRRVLCAYNSGEGCQGYHNICCDTRLTRRHVVRYTKLLRREGWLDYGHLTSEDDGYICGSGYWWTPKGTQLAEYAELHFKDWLV